MRTANELVSKMLSEMPYMVNANVVPYLIELAELAQKEAWNKAWNQGYSACMNDNATNFTGNK